MLYGDSRAALVMSIEPLLVAAYTDELDCIAMLSFPNNLVTEYGLECGTRLLTVNLYARVGAHASDLVNGPASSHRYTNFTPLIAEFVSNDHTRIEERKRNIEETEWQRALEYGQVHLSNHYGQFRNGLPLYSWRSALKASK